MLKLNVGGQQTVEQFKGKDFICVDIRDDAAVVCDISKNLLPYQDNSISAIYCSHTLEHIMPHRLLFTLGEFYRVLMPGGKLRIVVPDFDIALDAYQRKDYKFLSNTNVALAGMMMDTPLHHLISWVFCLLNEELVHCNGFNKQTMEVYLNKANFVNITFLDYNMHSDEFIGCDLEGHKLTSLYVEGVK